MGNKIYQLRKDRNMTQKQLAAEMGVSITAVSKWENNCSLPDVLLLCSLADYFHTTTDYLLGREYKRYKAIVAEPANIPRDAITKILENNRCSVIASVTTLDNLLDKLNKQSIDFITIESDMDKELDTINKIHEQYPDLKIFAFSNNNDSTRIQQAKNAGITKYYTKPFHENALIECIESMNDI